MHYLLDKVITLRKVKYPKTVSVPGDTGWNVALLTIKLGSYVSMRITNIANSMSQ